MVPAQQYSLKELLVFIQASELGVVCEAFKIDLSFTGIAPLDEANKEQVSFLSNSRYRGKLADSKALAVFVTPANQGQVQGLALITQNPYLAFARAAQFIEQRRNDVLALPVGVHASAQIDATAQIASSAAIAAGVVIGPNARIGSRVTIGANCVIGAGVRIGDDSILAPLVSVYSNVQIGERCRLQSQAVIGSDGFGYARTQLGWERIPQLGTVILEDDVHVGASSTIDRGALGPTHIQQGVIIDNQVQIAHNVIIGERTAIAGAAGIAGSSRIGADCTLAGASGVSGHLTLCDNVHIGMQAQVTNSITEPGEYASGTGLYSRRRWRRLVGQLRRLVK